MEISCSTHRLSKEVIKIASRGELKIKDILMMNQIKFEQEYIFPELVSSNGRPLRFDFIVFDDDGNIDFLIEFQGEQHYTSVDHFGGPMHLQRQKYNDSKKREFCMRKNYPLVTVPFWDYEKLNYDYLFNRAEELRI